VAEYTGRPLTADMFYENVRKLAIYYKAQVWYENNVKGIQVYFKNKGCEYMLASSPDIIKDILGETNVDRQTGVHMTEQIKMYAIGRLRD
jgi:hypothetical protein